MKINFSGISTVSAKILGCILLVSLLLRISFFLGVRPWDKNIEENSIISKTADASGYQSLAVNLLKSGRFSIDGVKPHFKRTPVYPVFMAVIYALFGIKPWAVLLAQIFMDGITLAVIFLLARLLFEEKTAVIAALIYAVEPTVIRQTATIGTDISGIFLFSVFLLFFIKSVKKDSLKLFAFSGLLLGICTLTRPVFQYVSLLAGIIIILSGLKGGFAAVIRKLAVFIIVFSVTLLPWHLRNLKSGGRFALCSVKRNYFHISTQLYEMERTQKTIEEIVGVVDNQYITALREKNIAIEDIDSFEAVDVAKTMFLSYLRKHWKQYIIINIRGMVRLFLSTGSYMFYEKLGRVPTEISRQEGPLDINYFQRFNEYLNQKKPVEVILLTVFLFLLIFTYAMGLSGMYWIVKEKKYLFVIGAVLIISYFAFVQSPGCNPRMKMPIMPIYIPIAAYGLRKLIFKNGNEVKNRV